MAVGIFCMLGAVVSHAQTKESTTTTKAPSVTTTIDASEADGDVPRRGMVAFNKYEGPYATLGLHFGLLLDYAAYSQDDDSEAQVSWQPATKLRDFRFAAAGRFPQLPRLSYTVGYMYDATNESWRFRQTGLMLEVHEDWGRLFIGRTKEGISMSRVMVGYQGFALERTVVNDALLPALADGIKWMGNVPSGKLVYSFGAFFDKFSEDETFNKYDNQFAGRLVWLPFIASDSKSQLHVAVAARYGESNDGFLQFRSKPEAYPAQEYAIDTGKFAAHHSHLASIETYYRSGPLVAGFEYFFNQTYSQENRDPYFHGGEVVIGYTVTGETRPYNRRAGFFERIEPAQSVFDGGRGAWELVARLSYADLDSGLISGGKFWRITPMVNWHMSESLRLSFVYGYSVLDRFGVQGGTHFFQSRVQFQY